MSVHTLASLFSLSIRAALLPFSGLTSRIQLAVALWACIALGLQGEAVGAATGKPVAYALTPNNTITVIDTGNQQVLRTVTLAGPGKYIAGTPDGKQLYVTSNGRVWVIDTQTYQVIKTIQLDMNDAGIAIPSDGTRVYVLSAYPGSPYGSDVWVIDPATNSVLATVFNTKANAQGIVVTPNGKLVYVPQLGGLTGDGALDAIDTATNALIPGPVYPSMDDSETFQFAWAAVSPDSTKVYTGDDFGAVLAFSTTTNQYIGISFSGGRLSTPLPNSNILYGTTAPGTLVALNTQTDAVAATIPLASTINGMAATPDGTQLYVSNSNAQSIAIIDTATNTVSGSLAVTGATGLAIVAAPPSFVSTPPVVTLTVSPISVPPGSPASAVWNSTGSSSCTKSGAWSGSAPLQGTAQVTFNTPGDYSFTLTCIGPGGATSVTAKLTVITGTALTLNATDVQVGGTLVATWKAFAGATTCQASGTNTTSGPVATSGSMLIGPVTSIGSVSGSFGLTCTGPTGSQSVDKNFTIYSPGPLAYSSLALPDNVYAIGTPGTAPAGGGLAAGYAFDANELQALPRPLTAFGQAFTLGTATNPSGVWGQKIALGSAQLTELVFVATAANGNQTNQKFVVTYSDGTATTYSQSLSDWKSPGNGYAGEDGFDPATLTAEDTAIAITHRITPTGALGCCGWYLHKYRMSLDGTKVATSLQLPNNRNVIVFALNATKAPTATPESLSSALNVTALASAGQASTGPRLASGYAYDASLVPNGFSAVGQHFTIGAANQPDAASQGTITLPAKTRLGLTVLAAGLNGSQPNQSFKVTYQDGSTTVFTQSVSDWNKPQNYPSESIARNTAFRITPAGTRQAGVWDLYGYTFQTNSAKKVVSLTLPNNRNVVVLAINTLTQ